MQATLSWLSLSLLFQHAYAKVPLSPEDTYAFPKYRINFLNNHPISSDLAQAWLSDGLQDGVREFMGTYHSIYESDWPQLDGAQPDDGQQSKAPTPKLKHMRLSPHRSYLCLTPPTTDVVRQVAFEAPETIDPAKTWQLLAPLTGHCLYHRQGWFTYSYCHNSHVRQFRERSHQHPHPPGGRIPQEDPEYHAYTLGKSPTSLRPSKDSEVAVTQQDQREQPRADLQLHEGGGQRYLTSKWSDGTMCDKTGRGREVEIQFHCSMTTTDQIQFLKETSVCQYLLVIHTPRLCGEPGFQSLREKQPAAPIHCREILPPSEMPAALEMQEVQSEAPWPHDSFTRNPIHSPIPIDQPKKGEPKMPIPTVAPAAGLGIEALQQALQQLLGQAVILGDDPHPPTEDGHHHHDHHHEHEHEAGAAGENLELGDIQVIHGEDGQDLYVQVLDIEGHENENQEQLLQRVRDALHAQLQQQHPTKKTSEEEEQEEAENALYYNL